MKKQFTPALRLTLWLLAVLVVAGTAFGLRFRAVSLLPIDYDEDDYLLAGQHYAAALVSGDLAEFARYDYNYEHPPLAKMAYGAVLAFLPQVEEIPQRPVSAPPAASLPQPHLTAARLTSAIFGTLQVLLLAVLNPLAGLFLAVHTFTIKYTSQVMLEALPALTSLITVAAYARSRRRFNAWLLLSALALGLTAAGKYLYAAAGIVILLHWLMELRDEESPSARRRSLGLLFTWGLLSLLIFFAANPYLWPDPIGRLLQSLTYNLNYSAGEQVQSAALPFWQPLAYLTSSVPWHPGVFLVSLDGLIAVLGMIGFGRLWREKRIYALWLLTGLVFLLVWPTKWPQYILLVTAPLSLSAAYGLKIAVWQPLKAFYGWLRTPRLRPSPAQRALSRRELKKALPWLAPGLIALVLITLFPLIFQGAMALTNFSGPAIRDGMRGGVWRALFQGLSGQETAVFYPAFSGPASGPKVKFAGLSLLYTLVGSIGSSVLSFEVLWTVLAVATQTALGLGLALLLHRRGVAFKGFWRVLFILPWAVPEFVGALTWSQLFDPRFGAFTLAGRTWSQTPGFIPPGAAANPSPDTVLIALVISALWYGFPLMLLAASAGLKALPPEVYDAAALDGANAWQTFRQITFPMLLPLLAPAIILRAIFAFNQFYLFTVFQPPFPLLTLSAISYYFFGSFQGGQFALSAALNILTVAFLLLLILGFNKVSRAAEGVTYA